MSFSSTVKEELSRQLTTARHCQIAEMAAILSLCGRVKISHPTTLPLPSIQKIWQLQENTLHY